MQVDAPLDEYFPAEQIEQEEDWVEDVYLPATHKEQLTDPVELA